MAMMLSVRKAAEKLGFTEPAVRALVARRQIRHFRRGKRGRIYFRQEWLDEYIVENTVEPSLETPRAPRRKPTYAPRELSTRGWYWHLMGGSRAKRARNN